jgi:hypothetical protein
MTVSVGIASVQTGYYGVGTGLEVPGTITLGAPAPAGGSTIAVTSSANALVSASGTVAGSSTVSVPVAAGATTATFWLQGISVGTATVSAADLSGAFAPASGVTAAVVVPAISLSSAPTSTSTLSPPSVFYVYVGALYGNGTALYPEAVSPTVTGGLTVTATSSAPSVGALQTGTTNAATGTAVIPAGTYYTGQAGANLTFVPLSNGTTTLSISAPGFAAAATNYGPASQVVTVGQPGITLQGGIQVGGGLQYPLTGTLQVGESGGLTVRVASSDATTLLVSPDAVTPGSPFIDVFVGSGATTFTYYVQGVGGAVGSPTVTVTAPAFSAGTQTVIVATPQLTFYTGLPSSESATSPDAPFEIATYVPGFTYENVSAGSSLVVTLSSTNPAVASLTTSSQSATSPVTVTIPAGAYTSAASVSAGGVALHAVAAGAVNIAATATGTKSATQGVTLN